MSFITDIAPIIVAVAHERGYNYPSAIIAQACLESNYGKSSLAYKYHNYFGLKCGSKWTGARVNLKTKEEYKAGTMTTITDAFRVYNSMKEGVQGYFDFININRYRNLKSATSSKNYIELIKKDGYATASNYVNAVYSIVNKYNLTKYDYNTSATGSGNNDYIYNIAIDVIKGKYGNGEERKKHLGSYYNEVQRKVNELLKK